MASSVLSRREIDAAVLHAGKEALEAIQRFLTARITRDELQRTLTGLGIGNLLAEYWPALTCDEQYAVHLNVLQMLDSLSLEIDYQIDEYGVSAVYEDLKEIAGCLNRIANGS